MGTITRSIANNIVTGGKLDGTDGLNGTIPASNIADASLTSITSLSPSLGSAITSVSVDPPAPAEGQIWYNSSSGTLKGYQLANVNAWASGGNLNTGRLGLSGAGTQTSALGFGGYAPGGPTELYNGTSWTNNPTGLGTARGLSGSAGTQTAALMFGGRSFDGTGPQLANTESWNGSTWSPVTSMGTSRYRLVGCGLQTAALAFGGNTGVFPTVTASTATESWSGSSWTTVASMNTGRRGGTGCGTQTAALSIGGSTSFNPNLETGATESWNGSAWTTSPASLNTAREYLSSAGIQTAAVAFGGSPVSAATELWNGTSWTSNPTGLATARNLMGSAGSQTAALAFGGNDNTTPIVNTEEWTGQALLTKTITVS
jgi:hypothetical protein